MTKKKSISLAAILCSAFLTTSLFMAVPVRGQQRQALSTALAAPAGAQPVGRLPGSQRLSLGLTLRLRNPSELQSLLNDLYDPDSPEYRHFLTVEQFTERFGPTVEDYEKAAGFAEAYGLTVTHTAPNRLVLDVNGTVADIERAFQVTMQVYQHPTEPRTYYAPDGEPSVEPGVPVQGVSGLNNFSPPRPAGLRRVARDESIHTNWSGTGPGGTFLGKDIRAAYMPGVTLNGSGQAVGLLQYGPYNLSDVQAYFSTTSQPLNVPIVNVLLDGVDGICGSGCDDLEEAIDIEQAVSMAPNLSAVIVYEGNIDVDILNQMAVDNVAKQLSSSWGWLPADPWADEPIFQEFAAQGQNLFEASGDSGAFNASACSSSGKDCTWYPADDPYVTAVGGTDLTTSGPGGAWQSETAWDDGGGGFSTNGISIPSYQAPVINSSNKGSKTLRNIPDVAAEANCDNYFCADGACGNGYVVCGTSLAAPRWAGILALANQQADGNPIGFLNPTLYALGQGPECDNDFHDITGGNNFNSASPNLFSAVSGYDLATGWGTPNGQSLLTALSGVPTGPNFALAPSPSSLSLPQGNDGTSAITLSAVNGFKGTVDFTVTALGLPGGVTATLNPTSLAGSGSTTLNVSTTSATPPGKFPMVVTGTSGSLTQTAYVMLTVSSSPTAPVVSFSASSIGFGNQVLNTPSAALAEIVTNTGTAPLTISTATLGGTNASDFAKSLDTCTGATVAPKSTCTVSAIFTPAATGIRNASLSFTDNAGNSPQAVSLTGAGVNAAPTVSPTSEAFGYQVLNTSSATKTVTLTATTGLGISSITMAGTNRGNFHETNTCPASLAAKAKCTITLTYTPTILGAETASLTITDNASNSPQTVALSGTGVMPVVLSLTSLSFGNVAEGNTSAAKTIILTNYQTVALAGISVDFAGSADYSQTNTCGTSLAARGKCTITVTLKPSIIGADNATLRVTDSASNSPQTATLTGAGTTPATLTPASTTFVSEKVGVTSPAKVFTLTSYLSTTLSGIAISATGDFAVSSTTCTTSLAAKGKCTINVVFKPTATGTRTGTLKVTDSAGNSPQTSTLTGTGK